MRPNTMAAFRLALRWRPGREFDVHQTRTMSWSSCDVDLKRVAGRRRRCETSWKELSQVDIGLLARPAFAAGSARLSDVYT